MEKILIARETFATQIGDESIVVQKDITRVRADHPVVKANPDAFVEVDDKVLPDIEDATATPGRKRGQKVGT